MYTIPLTKAMLQTVKVGRLLSSKEGYVKYGSSVLFAPVLPSHGTGIGANTTQSKFQDNLQEVCGLIPYTYLHYIGILYTLHIDRQKMVYIHVLQSSQMFPKSNWD